MGYVVKDGGNFRPAPAGLHRAVCVDVVDMGVIKSKFGDREKVRLVWQIDEADKETGKLLIVSQMYTPSLNEKAKLRHHLESWRGRPFSVEERKGFDLDNVLHVSCQLQVVHNEHDGNVYANVAAIVPLSKGQARLAPTTDYVRMKDREGGEREPGADDDIEDDDEVPF